MNDNPLSMSSEDFHELEYKEIVDESPEVEEIVSEESPVEEENVTEEASEIVEEGEVVVEEATEEPVEETSKSPKEIDYKAGYEQLLAPLDIDGEAVELKSVEEVKKLLTLGASHNTTMERLNPSLKLIKLLEDADLLDEEKLNYLIDLSEKKPEAITKLVKDAGIDPYTIDVEEESSYKPETRDINEAGMAFTEVLKAQEHRKEYRSTIDTVLNSWDEGSKSKLVESPEAVKDLIDHAELGVFQLVNTEIKRQRMLGGLKNMSAYDAYTSVGTAMYQRGELPVAGTPYTPSETPKENKPTPDVQGKKSATIASSGGRKIESGAKPKSPLSMSASEFETSYNKLMGLS